MLRDTAINLLMQRLGNLKGDTVRQNLINEMVFVQESICEVVPELPWFLVSEQYSASAPEDEPRIILPPGFLREFEEGALWIQDGGEWKELFKEDFDKLKSANLAAGVPKYYSTTGDYFILFPTPIAVTPLLVKYYQKDTSLAGVYGDASNVENKWLKWHGDLLMAETGFIYASQYDQNQNAASVFRKQADAAWARYRSANIAQNESNRSQDLEDY